MKQRSIAVCIILSIITCGIYGLYWLFCLAEDMKILSGNPALPSGGKLILLTLITCGIYGWYWLFKCGEAVDIAKNANGIPSSNTNILYLVLAIIGLAIIDYALMQDTINTFAAKA